MTIVLKLTNFEVDTIFGDKRPEYQKTISFYSSPDIGYVSITAILHNSGKEKIIWEGKLSGFYFSGVGFAGLARMANQHNFIIGEWEDDDVVTLTPLGEQEAALLSSVPKLFDDNPVSGV